jgi:hypothetical protein
MSCVTITAGSITGPAENRTMGSLERPERGRIRRPGSESGPSCMAGVEAGDVANPTAGFDRLDMPG